MTLAESLKRIREGSKEKIPENARVKMHKATEQLRESGLPKMALSTGDKIPEFTLPDIAGEALSSDDLLRPEGLVITFYRGVW